MSDLLDKYRKSSSGSSLRNKYQPRGGTAKKSKKKGKSPFGFVQNVAGDIRDISVGAGPAVIETGKAVGGDALQAVEDTVRAVTGQDPPERITAPGKPGRRTKKLAGQIKQGYVDMYGPLFKGDFDKFLDNLYNDPVYVGLDVLTVGAGASKLFVKVAPSAAKGGKTIYLTTASGQKIGKPLARGELRAQLQALSTKVNPEVRAAKIERTRLTRKDANVRAQNIAFENALRRNKGQPAKVAAALLGRFDRQALDEYTAHLRAKAEENPKGTEAQALRIITNPKVQALFDAPTPRVGKVLEEARGLGEKQKAILKVAPETAEARRFLPARMAGGAKWDDEAGDFVGGPSIEDLKARGLDPIYFPDTSNIPRKGFTTGRGGGVGIPNKTANQRQNKGSLMLAGQLILDPATLNESFLRSAKYAHYNDVHDSLVSLAQKVDYPEPGMVLIRRKRSERVDPKDKARGDFEEWASTHLDDKGEWLSKDSGLVTRSFDDAAKTEDGKYLAVPAFVAKTLAGEFTRQGQLLYWMNRYPMRVWRALVLGLRPAYLVNNAVGNTLMYLMHSGRPEDVRQLAGALKQFAKKSEGKQIDRLLEKHFAGQVRGGFIASQYPELRPRGRLARAGSAAVGAIPALDKRWEQALRRAKVKAELKKHPELRQHAERMGRENAYFEKIAPLLDERPDIVTQVYDRVNDALGDYDGMSAFERGTIRNLFPFYAWYKAISVVSAKLAIEQPLKVNLLARIGEIAVEQNLEEAGFDRDEIPSSLLGFIPSKREGSRVRGLNTSSVNPYATVGQLADFIAAATQGPGALGRKLPGSNPLWTELLAYIFGQTPSGYGTPDVPGMGVVEALPQSRLLGALERQTGIDFPGIKPAPDGDTFNDRDAVDELLRFLGVPYARVSPSAAKRVANG